MTVRNLHFSVLLGSLRRGSFSRALANTLDELAPDHVGVTLLNSIGEIPSYNEDIQNLAFPPEVLTLAQSIADSDAIVIVTPEYNHSVPGALKNALDWLSRLPQHPFAGKPVAIQTASPGLLGGARARPHLIEVMEVLHALLLHEPEVAVAKVGEKIDVKTASLRCEKTRELVANQLASLAELTRKCQQGLTRRVQDDGAPVRGDNSQS